MECKLEIKAIFRADSQKSDEHFWTKGDLVREKLEKASWEPLFGGDLESKPCELQLNQKKKDMF